MIYTASRPPVIKANLGSTPWPTISTVSPWIEYVVVTDESGTLSEGDTLTLTGADPHLMTQVANTPIWIHKLGNFYTLPTTGLELAYYVTEGDGGNIVEEGTVEISDSGSTVSGSDIVSVDFLAPPGVSLPTSVGAVKPYPVKFIPFSATGEIQTIDNATITITPVSTGLPTVTDALMTETNNVHEYTWEFNYGSTEELYTVMVKAHLDGSGTNFRTYYRTVETFKRKEYNPIRVKPGFVS
jgi:hypothetical protein